MSVVPFGAIGAITGHYALSVDLMFFSALGIVALTGVVVNASLVLVDYSNRRRRAGESIEKAITASAIVRFRPIILTSVTTFVGLIPLMTTTTPSTAPFLPMAVSLAWGGSLLHLHNFASGSLPLSYGRRLHNWAVQII